MKKIRIVSPAKSIDQLHVDFAENFLEQHGFEIEIGTYALGQDHYFSGTIQERLSDFQYALDDPSIDIILCARGGYGSVQLIDELDFSAFLNDPKLIVGYSDVTVFHSHITANFKIPTLHASAPLNFAENTPEALESLLNAFNGIENVYKITPHSLNVLGEVEAMVIGGNLAILYSLLGTNSEADFKDKILFIEDVGEAVYAVDRMFYALKKAGKLSQIKALMVGGMTNMKDSEIPYGKSIEEVIHSHIAPLNIPLVFNFPAGHIDDNRAVIIGKKATLSADSETVIFRQ